VTAPRLSPAETAPKRIQRKRTKGWRMPEGAKYVGRPSRYGNPFQVPGPATRTGRLLAKGYYQLRLLEAIETVPAMLDEIRAELAGRDLACWCPLDQPCHADVLLAIANGSAS
jgi:hypothetical protein